MARFYQARQRSSDARWDYTVSSDEEKWCYPLGYCAGWRDFTPQHYLPADECDRLNAKFFPDQHKFHTIGHASPAEAEACYRAYQLDHELTFFDDRESADHLHRCEAPGCLAFTSGIATCGQFGNWALCNIHRTREIVTLLLK